LRTPKTKLIQSAYPQIIVTSFVPPNKKNLFNYAYLRRVRLFFNSIPPFFTAHRQNLHRFFITETQCTASVPPVHCELLVYIFPIKCSFYYNYIIKDNKIILKENFLLLFFLSYKTFWFFKTFFLPSKSSCECRLVAASGLAFLKAGSLLTSKSTSFISFIHSFIQ